MNQSSPKHLYVFLLFALIVVAIVLFAVKFNPLDTGVVLDQPPVDHSRTNAKVTPPVTPPLETAPKVYLPSPLTAFPGTVTEIAASQVRVERKSPILPLEIETVAVTPETVIVFATPNAAYYEATLHASATIADKKLPPFIESPALLSDLLMGQSVLITVKEDAALSNSLSGVKIQILPQSVNFKKK